MFYMLGQQAGIAAPGCRRHQYRRYRLGRQQQTR